MLAAEFSTVEEPIGRIRSDDSKAIRETSGVAANQNYSFSGR